MILYGITEDEAYAALKAERDAGRIDRSVSFKLIRQLTPRGGGVATEVQFEAWERNRGRRLGNSGAYGAMNWEGAYAATYDEWGFFLQHLYDIHADMVCGSPTHPTYADRDDYVRKTGATYTADLAEKIEGEGDPYPWLCGRNQVGRRGATRLSWDDPNGPRWGKLATRTPEWVRQFRGGEVY